MLKFSWFLAQISGFSADFHRKSLDIENSTQTMPKYGLNACFSPAIKVEWLNISSTGTGVTVYLDPLGSLTPGGQDTPGYLDPCPGYLDPQAAKYPLSGILPADTLIGVY